MKPTITDSDSVHSFMLKQEFANGEQKIVNILDDHFTLRDNLEKWEWEVLKINILGSIKKVNLQIENKR